jgi:hypothetical protein
VEVLARHGSEAAGRNEGLPGDEPVEHRVGQSKGTEEPNRVTAPDASSGAHT